MTDATTGPVVRLSGVVKTYRAGDVEVPAIKGISFDIPRQRFSMIVGPSGSGKTTLLNLIGCIDKPTAGKVIVGRQDIGTLTVEWLDELTPWFTGRRIYEAAPEQRNPQSPLVADAVERLYELDPGRTRALLLDEIGRPVPHLPFRTLAILPDATLPAMDRVLLEHLEHDGSQELIARYATGNILDGVKAWYAKHDAEMRARKSSNVPDIASPACEPALIAYFLRVDAAWGEHVLRESLADRGYPMGRCWMSILGKAAAYYVSPEWERTAIMALQDPVVVVKADAVKALGEHGSAASASAVWESFGYWHEWWKDRPEMLNEENRRFEQVFLQATEHPRNWLPAGGDAQRIRALCITDGCRMQAEEFARAAR